MSNWFCYSCEQPFTLQGGIPFCSNCGGTSIVKLEDQNQQPSLLDWIFNTGKEKISQWTNTYLNEGSSYSVPDTDSWSRQPVYSNNPVWETNNVVHDHGYGDYVPRRITNNEVYDHYHGNENHGHGHGHGHGMDVDVSPPRVESFRDEVATTNDDDEGGDGGGGGSSSPTPASQAVIDSLPVIKVSKNDLSLNPHCTFCMVKFKLKAKAKKLPCKHIFHSQCIDPWLAERANTCPVCRQEVKFGPQGSRTAGTSSSRVGTDRSRRVESYCPHHRRSRLSRLWPFH